MIAAASVLSVLNGPPPLYLCCNGDLSEANDLLSSYFPDAHTQAEAYGALDFGTSSNKYDTTLEKIIDGIERGIYMD